MTEGFEEVNVYCPTVKWSQRKASISLQVVISDSGDCKVDISENSITFQAHGNGAQGMNLYKFSLNFYKGIVRESCMYKYTDNRTEILITKKEEGWWPRLVPEKEKKPHFLKLDFDKWIDESDEEEFQKNFEQQKMAEMAKKMLDSNSKKESEVASILQNFYIIMYNCVQLFFFFIIVSVSLGGRVLSGPDFYEQAYHSVGILVYFAVILSYLEPLHPLLGLVKTGVFFPFVQVSGRCIALLCLWLSSDHIEGKGQMVWNLYVFWGLAEIIRYPNYILQTMKRENKVVTWLRYHSWIFLYPLGGFAEFQIIRNAAALFVNENSYNWRVNDYLTVSFASFLKFYTLLLLPSIAIMMRHMWKLRQKKYGKRRVFKQA